MSEFRHWHRNRLLKLVKLLRTKKVANHFNLDDWANKELGEFTKKKVDCGTEACAVGWACTIPSFRKAGLKLANSHEIIEPMFNEYRGLSAAAQFFGMSYRESEQHFHPVGYPEGYDENGNWRKATPKDVANKLVLFLKEKAKSETSLA